MKAINDGTTPLHLACHKENEEMILDLLNAGASVEKVDDHERTPLEIVRCQLDQARKSHQENSCPQLVDYYENMLIKRENIFQALNAYSGRMRDQLGNHKQEKERNGLNQQIVNGIKFMLFVIDNLIKFIYTQ
ncbi:MAG: hypothetical protein ACHQUC_05665 [Chlamydiales bacterium]